jgi:methyl-accepting chemotaxis protein
LGTLNENLAALQGFLTANGPQILVGPLGTLTTTLANLQQYLGNTNPQILVDPLNHLTTELARIQAIPGNTQNPPLDGPLSALNASITRLPQEFRQKTEEALLSPIGGLSNEIGSLRGIIEGLRVPPGAAEANAAIPSIKTSIDKVADNMAAISTVWAQDSALQKNISSINDHAESLQRTLESIVQYIEELKKDPIPFMKHMKDLKDRLDDIKKVTEERQR